VSELDTPADCLKAYEDGLPGWTFDMRANVEFADTQKYQYFSEPNIKGSGRGKRVLLWQYAQKLDATCFTEKQTTGDCFVAGTLVRMGDGTEKPIELVKEGEHVASPFGGVRRVESVFSKPYSGWLRTVRAEGCADSVTATEDHRFVSHVSKDAWEWAKVGELGKGDRVFIPAGDVSRGELHVFDLGEEDGCSENPNDLAVGLQSPARRKAASHGKVRAVNGKTECNRHVILNEDVAWLIGIWLAEGSTDKSPGGAPHGLCWNLCKDELAIARRIRHIVRREFGVESKIYTLPSKPSCLFVRCRCAPIARWMYRICGSGNTYSKRLPEALLTSPSAVKLWCLRGWLEGDGWVQSHKRPGTDWDYCKTGGVSVSRELVRGMRYLALSSGVWGSETIRKEYKRSRQARELHFYGTHAVAVRPGRLAQNRRGGRASMVWRVENGFAPRIKECESIPFCGDVYCIGVEVDHAFIANGYAVHNCVSHGSRNARDITRAVEILVKKEPEDWFKKGATEPTYGARGHGGQGMSPGRASRFERDVGFLARHNYEGVVDLSKYNSSIGTRWGPKGVPQNVQELCKKNRVGLISQVRTQEDLMDAMFNGYAAHSGQYAAWTPGSNSKGIHGRAVGGWNHDMCIAGYDDSREFFPFRVWMIPNSWGRWNQKPKAWPKEYGEWVPGMILTSGDDFNVCVEANDCWVYGGIDGYPPQKLPDYGTVGLLQHD
jgi:hypothetical protein